MDISIVKLFVTLINKHDSEGLYALMADDYLFIDSQANEISGKNKAKSAWDAYFQLFPEYEIKISEIAEFNNLIIVLVS